jgi:hypothetical protein
MLARPLELARMLALEPPLKLEGLLELARLQPSCRWGRWCYCCRRRTPSG